MRIAKGILFFLISITGLAQTVTFGDSTTLYLGDETTFFFGGNTTLNGNYKFSKQEEQRGTSLLVSYSNLDFVDNTDVGNLKFNGPDDQSLDGDTLDVGNFIVDKLGKLNLLTPRVLVSGSFETANGVIESVNENGLIVTGSSPALGTGFVEGKLVGQSQGTPITFPMGVDGNPNYVTISNLPAGTIASVECRVPNPQTLLPSEDIIGISEKAEWLIKVSGDSVAAQIEVNFSGADLSSFSGENFNNIRSRSQDPGLVVFSETDTLFHIVETNGSATNTEGSLTSSQSVFITQEGRRFAIALIPSLGERNELFVPNAFSPGSMIEENQVFRVFYAGAVVTNVTIQLYDSFNQLIYSASDSGDNLDLSNYKWDGVLDSGLDAPEGVYYYKVQLVSEEEVVNSTGSVLLVK
ncbi:gliding motility-associated C-terminal domain-containing protein [Ekhidna sp.]|uniref:T9SS type B sorting domain-containing protein n=1 Tax=Ekhidna sp. TaxID=2608089 RepID=UPI003CCC0AB6